MPDAAACTLSRIQAEQPVVTASLQACNAFWTRHLHPCVRWLLGASTQRCWHLARTMASCGLQGSMSRRLPSCTCVDKRCGRHVNFRRCWCRLKHARSIVISIASHTAADFVQEMREQKKRVTDLDWSLENHQLLTSSGAMTVAVPTLHCDTLIHHLDTGRLAICFGPAADGSVCLSSHDDGIWSMARRFETATPAAACLFHPVNQNL